MAREYGHKDFDASSIRSPNRPSKVCSNVLPNVLPNVHLGLTSRNRISRGLAAMPAQERSIRIDGRALGGDHPQRLHREAMARNTSSQGSQGHSANPRADAQYCGWDDEGGWGEHDE